ncbi:site-specific integrase [Cyclobacterium amurskyense]|uniref:tyrosine-type recombinase/integrase n=1 Tax=Cyclobacterium amurskyense TaxID=320787 RepID=UPI0009FD12A2
MKHRTTLLIIQSVGLRISEAINLRVRGIHSEEGYLFIKGEKNLKDGRNGPFSQITLGTSSILSWI